MDYSQLNQIDMDCAIDDDEDSFGAVNVTFKGKPVQTADPEVDSYKRNTGVIIDLNDDDDKPMRMISAKMVDDGIAIEKNFNSESQQEFSGYNNIDMETDYYDDTEDDYVPVRKQSNEDVFGFVDEEMLEEKKSAPVSQETLEKNYLKKLEKKHASTINKKAHSMNVHFSGNPEKEAAAFNQEMMPSAPSAASVGASEGGGGMGEAVEKAPENNLLEELFTVLGFDVIKNSDDTVNAFDLCDPNNDISAKDMPELISKLGPYIDDCIICPMEIETGEQFDNYDDWCSWYDDEKEAQYPKCKWSIDCLKALK